jgi:hypothetical protein
VVRLPWFRMWNEARNDAKLRCLDDAEHRCWFRLLCYASEQDDRGSVPVEGYVLAIEVADGDAALLERTLAKLLQLEVLAYGPDGVLRFQAFDKRQYDKPSDHPDRVRERVRRSRERRREDVTGNAPVSPGNAAQRPATPGNAPDVSGNAPVSPRIAQRRGEEKREEPAAAGVVAGAPAREEPGDEGRRPPPPPIRAPSDYEAMLGGPTFGALAAKFEAKHPTLDAYWFHRALWKATDEAPGADRDGLMRGINQAFSNLKVDAVKSSVPAFAATALVDKVANQAAARTRSAHGPVGRSGGRNGSAVGGDADLPADAVGGGDPAGRRRGSAPAAVGAVRGDDRGDVADRARVLERQLADRPGP